MSTQQNDDDDDDELAWSLMGLNSNGFPTRQSRRPHDPPAPRQSHVRNTSRQVPVHHTSATTQSSRPTAPPTAQSDDHVDPRTIARITSPLTRDPGPYPDRQWSWRRRAAWVSLLFGCFTLYAWVVLDWGSMIPVKPSKSPACPQLQAWSPIPLVELDQEARGIEHRMQELGANTSSVRVMMELALRPAQKASLVDFALEAIVNAAIEGDSGRDEIQMRKLEALAFTDAGIHDLYMLRKAAKRTQEDISMQINAREKLDRQTAQGAPHSAISAPISRMAHSWSALMKAAWYCDIDEFTATWTVPVASLKQGKELRALLERERNATADYLGLVNVQIVRMERLNSTVAGLDCFSSSRELLWRQVLLIVSTAIGDKDKTDGRLTQYQEMRRAAINHCKSRSDHLSRLADIEAATRSTYFSHSDAMAGSMRQAISSGLRKDMPLSYAKQTEKAESNGAPSKDTDKGIE